MVELEIFLIGAIIVIGFFAQYLFKRTKIPEVLLLILLGVLLGSVFHVVDGTQLASLAPFFGAVALIIILFDGGLNLNLFKVLGELFPAFSFTVLSFLAVTIAITLAAFLNGWNFFHALLLGTILGGTASNFVIPVVARLNVSQEVKSLLSLESAFNDTLTIVCTIALVGIIATNSVNLQGVSNAILGAFTIAAVVGLVAGIVWLKVMAFFHEKEFGYMLTLAAIFMLYAGVEAVKANGAIAVLVFGLIMGSATHLQRLLDGNETPVEFTGPLKTFHNEIAFFVRTFFFVYLGAILNLGLITLGVMIISLAIFVAIVVGRFISVGVFSHFSHHVKNAKGLMTVMLPRGLAAAVLASMPASQGVKVPMLEEVVFTVIILTNILATVGVFYFERRSASVVVSTSNAKEDVLPASKPRVVITK